MGPSLVRRRGGALVAAVGLFQLPESEERHEGGRLRRGSFSGQGQPADPPGSSGLRGAAHGRWVRPIVRAFPPLWPPRPCRRDGGLGRVPVRLGHQNEFCGARMNSAALWTRFNKMYLGTHCEPSLCTRPTGRPPTTAHLLAAPPSKVSAEKTSSALLFGSGPATWNRGDCQLSGAIVS
eukprot:COSAG01_NODE_1395_length_10476_cov_11.562331_15_plen_179_part_00